MKDNEMREQVRGSFLRVSEGLTRGWPTRVIGDTAREPVTSYSEPSIVNRLVRIAEELLERDDVRMDADVNWYWKKLQEIKAEINAEGVRADGGAEAQERGEGKEVASISSTDDPA